MFFRPRHVFCLRARCVKTLVVLHISICAILFGGTLGEVRYSVPEEMHRGSVIGNLAHDLGLNVDELIQRNARVVAEGSRQFCELSTETGSLLVSERMDREELCAQIEVCIVQFQLLLENPLKVYSLVLDIQDINDNSPFFDNGQIELELLESTVLGRRFPLESARDPDMGANSVQHYRLSENDYFALEMNTHVNANAYPELVLKKPLDRESQVDHFLTISGVDGGHPPLSGTASIHIHVLDANDNVPVFSQRVYKAYVHENSDRGTVLAKLNATDLDSGLYGTISYSFSHVPDKTRGVVEIDPVTGEVRVTGAIDYEEASTHELDIQAKDGGGQSSHCKLIIEVTDLNDNAPVIEIKSSSPSVSEDASPGTMVALLNVYDLDTGASGRVTCDITDNAPFKLISEVKNYFMLVTDGVLDREKHSYYNITVTAVDAGTPPMFSSNIVSIMVADINDNPPVFTQSEHTIEVPENRAQGLLVIRVRAEDADAGQNAQVQYSLAENAVSYFSINAETGEIFTLRPFDYEVSSHFWIRVMARDGGSPTFTSTCTVRVFIRDENDNAPVILYPVQSSGYVADDIVPLAAPKGYLVTKVVAVDADAGHNAWLSYHIIKATQPNLFSIGLHCGEIRTLRPFVDDDEPKQILVVAVRDNGAESLSATAIVNIAIGEGLPVIDELSAFGLDESRVRDDFTLYLIIALAGVSILFLILITIVVYMRFCRHNYMHRTSAKLPVFPPTYGPPGYFDVSRCGTLQNDDRYSSFLTTGSWRGDFRFGSEAFDYDTLRKSGTMVRVSGNKANIKVGSRAHLSVTR
ncbi:protocadherin beta-15 [Pygocentrus nattereri]|uniref:protocadherin beta-15 n=1 Tax=Pygocentrus nattereri TaxID=42514 RepID=UPI00081422B8|nr:protocadherin beta-15 [Pygocentrus nattereri]